MVLLDFFGKPLFLREHCCINASRMSWVRVTFSGTMAWLTHAYTLPLFVSRFLSFKHTCTHSAGSRILIFLRALFQRCSPDCVSASCSLQILNIYLKACSYWMQISQGTLWPPGIGLSFLHPSQLSGRMWWTERVAAERAESEAWF